MGIDNADNSKDSVQDANKIILSIGLIVVIVVTLTTTGWLVVQWLYAPGNFPIRKIELVNQLKQQRSAELQKVAVKAIDGGFFSMNVDIFRKELLLLPWIKNVSVRKVWPNKLLVTISERRPIVRWFSIDSPSEINQTYSKATDNNTIPNTVSETLLSAEGIIFAPEVTQEQQIKFSKLPLFSGPQNNVDKILKKCLQFIQIINPINIKVKRCTMDSRHAWNIELTTRLELKMGKNEVIKRLQRFVDVFSQQLGPYLKYVAYVDLRYSNGISVKWIEESANKADEMRLN
jgi:cell division protein FtsQ